MKAPLHIILIDDNPDDRLLTIRELRREFPDLQVEQITDAKSFAQALEAGDFGHHRPPTALERWPGGPVRRQGPLS